jgi:hypothetical protein
MRFGHRLLATARGMARSRSLATHPKSLGAGTAPSLRNRLVTSGCGQVANSLGDSGGQTCPKPASRRKLRDETHIILVDAKGIPFAVILTAANRYDVTQLDILFDSIHKCEAGR